MSSEEHLPELVEKAYLLRERLQEQSTLEAVAVSRELLEQTRQMLRALEESRDREAAALRAASAAAHAALDFLVSYRRVYAAYAPSRPSLGMDSRENVAALAPDGVLDL